MIPYNNQYYSVGSLSNYIPYKCRTESETKTLDLFQCLISDNLEEEILNWYICWYP